MAARSSRSSDKGIDPGTSGIASSRWASAAQRRNSSGGAGVLWSLSLWLAARVGGVVVFQQPDANDLRSAPRVSTRAVQRDGQRRRSSFQPVSITPATASPYTRWATNARTCVEAGYSALGADAATAG
jgi:hypothetical protein